MNFPRNLKFFRDILNNVAGNISAEAAPEMCTSLWASLQDADPAYINNKETWCHLQAEVSR